MAVNDIINDIIAVTAGTPVDFQPGAGVEIILTALATNSANAQVTMFDDTLSANIIASDTKPYISAVKVGITNTNFVRFLSGSGTVNTFFSGIQTAA